MSERSLRSLLAGLPTPTRVVGDGDPVIRSIAVDSRGVTPGALFVAMRGEHADGHDYIAQALHNGASAVLTDAARADIDLPAQSRAVQVAAHDVRRALSAIAAAFYERPSDTLAVVGVTGTNGKTTTTQMVAAILEVAGYATGVIGTVGARFGNRTWTLENTTPLPPQLQELLAQMRDDGAAAVAMEVSSHALALGRVEDVRFSVGAFTNLTRDHLDFHRTPEAYAQAKRRLFDVAQRCAFNADDPYGARWADEVRGRVPTLTYALRADADIVAGDVAMNPSGSTFTLDGRKFSVGMPGRFNVENALCAIACARLLGIGDDVCARGLAAVRRVPGRMEHVGNADVDVVVDYAHTPDSLENSLRALRETTAGRLIVVFGCGGDRDRGKRPQMGEIASRLADYAYVTSDNPRTEDPQHIIDEIVAGMAASPRSVLTDRRGAIEHAITEAGAGDTVLIAGKGHENYQIIGTHVLPFDDVAVARVALAARSGRR